MANLLQHYYPPSHGVHVEQHWSASSASSLQMGASLVAVLHKRHQPVAACADQRVIQWVVQSLPAHGKVKQASGCEHRSDGLAW